MASKVRVAWADVVDSDSDTQSQPDCGGVVVDIPEIVLDESSYESSDCGASERSIECFLGASGGWCYCGSGHCRFC